MDVQETRAVKLKFSSLYVSDSYMNDPFVIGLLQAGA